MLVGVTGLDVADAELDDAVEETEEVLLPVEDTDDVAIVRLPDIDITVEVPAETGPGNGLETGIGMITDGPVVDGDTEPMVGGVAEPELGAEGPALEDIEDVPAEGTLLQ